jgi:beta-glucosidase/6-phospho-beta-glucosidase/beta-galactosidase
MQLSDVLPNTPIYVTENGIADAQDDRRHLYIRRHMYALSRAIADGANVKGYFYWLGEHRVLQHAICDASRTLTCFFGVLCV